MTKYIDCEMAKAFLTLLYGDTAQDCIDSIPAADVQPVVHAHWIYKDYILDDIYGHWEGTCSNCGQRKRVDNYCPFCGAKMDEEAGKV